MIYTADFETTTKADDCRVWAYAICNVDNIDDVTIGTTIDGFMYWCKVQDENNVIYFHNLKFDGQFILYWLFNHGFKHVTKPEDKKDKTFTTLISDKGLYYQFEVFFKVKGKNVKKVTFLDSLKLIPLSVDGIAKALKLPISKLEIDYTSHNNLPEGADLTEQEKDYITNDVKIVAHAINFFKSQGLDKMTIGSCALSEYKDTIGKYNFKRYYPVAKYHDDVRQSYKGGFTWVNPDYVGKELEEGIVMDVNSLYPSVMYDEFLPYGTPKFFEGEYIDDPIYPLYIVMFRCQFKVKPGKIPTIQIKYGYGFSGNEYLNDSGDEEVVLCLTSVDLKLFIDHYDVYNIEWFSGWKFKSAKGLFNKYIDKWSTNKINAKKEGNHGLYLISKLFLNSLYGKFGTDIHVKAKVPYINDFGYMSFYDIEEEDKDGVYIAMASFITSYARNKTIRSAQIVMDNYRSGKSDIDFVYADTDSLHCISPGHKLPKGLDISDTKLGAWKFETKFIKAKFLRQKCYIETSTEDVLNNNPEYELKVTVAGMPKACHKNVNYDNFKIGASYTGKMQPKIVPGGVILSDIDFQIKE